MKTSMQCLGFRQTLVALAVIAVFGSAQAQWAGPPGPTQAQLAGPPESWVSIGVGAVTGDSKDRARFGMFNGLRDQNLYGLFDFEYVNRDPATARWTIFEGHNLGLETRELSFTTRKLGEWKVQAGYNEITREDPRTINTGMLGAGTTTPTVVRLDAPGTGQDLNLELKRKAVTLGGDIWITPNLQFESSFKNEDKNGARQFGRGFACSATWVAAGACASSTTAWALLFLPEPINSTIRQFDAKLNYSNDRMFVSFGYYGSFYVNDNGNLTPTIPGILNNPLGVPTALDSGLRTTLGLPMALQPDSQAHQFYVSGNYRFTPTIRATFKYAYTHATQNDDFSGNGFNDAPAGRSNLGGVLDTTLAQFGLTARPMPALSLLGNVRYEEKRNKTPIDYYNIEGSNKFTNGNPSPKKLAAKAEASYQLPQGYRATAGIDYESVDHGTFTPTDNVAGISGLRQKTEETGYRVELRRSMSEQLTGTISYVHSKREGNSPWLKPFPLPLTGVTEANPDPSCVPPPAPAFNNCIYNRTGIFPFIFEDRTRDKLRLMATWTPTDNLSLQFFVEDGRDKYAGPTEHGLRSSGMKMFSVDAAYTLSDAWKLTGYASRGDSTVRAGHSTGYDATLKDTNDSFGMGLIGKVSERLQMGADFTYLNDKLVYLQELDEAASATNIAFLAASGGLPDVTYRLLRLKLYGQYLVDKASSVRVDLIHQRTKFNEWTYQYNGVPFTYSDNTTLSAKEDQNVTFIGVSYIYRWQ